MSGSNFFGPTPAPAPGPAGSNRRKKMTEQAAARTFAAENADQLRYHHQQGHWLVWAGHHWRLDGRKQAFHWALDHCNKIGTRDAARVRFSDAVERAARVIPPIATCAADWNPDHMLLGTPEGVVDGDAMRPGQPSDMITRVTACAPADTCDCPLWFKFLDTVCNGQGEVIDFLQRFFGYCLTGSVREHKFLFLYGTGANGKGTLLSTLAYVLGDYAVNASVDLLLESKFDRHPTELARLDGPRVVLIHETKEGRRFDEARIKGLTGGDKITARYMRQNDFEFEPQFKLVISGNHQPNLRTVDEAIRRRILMLLFAVTIAPDKRDPTLADKLRSEAAGILRWLIEGRDLYLRIGLKPPPAVTTATENYLDARDDIAIWLDERTNKAPVQTAGKVLYADFVLWKKDCGEFPCSRIDFYTKLDGKGIPRGKKNMHGECFQGIELSQQSPYGP